MGDFKQQSQMWTGFTLSILLIGIFACLHYALRFSSKLIIDVLVTILIISFFGYIGILYWLRNKVILSFSKNEYEKYVKSFKNKYRIIVLIGVIVAVIIYPFYDSYGGIIIGLIFMLLGILGIISIYFNLPLAQYLFLLFGVFIIKGKYYNLLYITSILEIVLGGLLVYISTL